MYTSDTNCNRNSNPNVNLISNGKDNAGGFRATNCGKLKKSAPLVMSGASF